jgi:hypothetical protein
MISLYYILGLISIFILYVIGWNKFDRFILDKISDKTHRIIFG